MTTSREIDPFSDAKVVDSWRKNAEPWTQAIRDDLIESRRLVTNRAIVDAVLALAPRSVLDIGCGEGWLARALAPHGVRVTGVDAIPTLIEQANQLGGGEYRVASYDDIAAGKLDVIADVAVANFALIGKEAVDALVRRLPRQLTPSGSLVIQTLHPVVAGGDLAYKDGWRPGSWSGFGSSFTDPAPWYFRTLESWVELLVDSGFAIGEIREPLHPTTGKPASVIFVARVAG